MANIYVTIYFTLFLHALFTLFWTKRTWNIVNPGTKFFPPPHCPLFPRLRWKCLEQTYLANSLVSCMLFSNVHSQNYLWTKARENSRKRCEFVFSIRTPLRSALHPLPPPDFVFERIVDPLQTTLSWRPHNKQNCKWDSQLGPFFFSRCFFSSSLMKWVTGRGDRQRQRKMKEKKKKREKNSRIRVPFDTTYVCSFFFVAM